MDAKISSIRLITDSKGIYWLITLVDDNGNIIGTFGDENHCSDIDFRNQTFGIMKILNNWNLLNLDGNNKYYPILVDKEFGRINFIANSSGHYLNIDYITGEVLNGTDCDISNFYQQYITNIVSQSGCLSISILSDPPDRAVNSHRGLFTSLVYLGFQPIYSAPVTEERENLGASTFRKFVCGVLDLCNVSELIQSDNYPEVSVKMDSTGKIVAIGNSESKEYLSITNSGYDLLESESKIK